MSDTPSTIPPLRILVVDDEPYELELLRGMLKSQGHLVTVFSSPTQAAAALRKGDFDLLLADLHMPEISGSDLLKAALVIDPHLVVVIMTGNGSIDTAVETMKDGAFDYILKPFKLKGLSAVLSRAFTLRKLRLEKEALQIGLEKRTRELEAAVKELEAFSYSVSHDLRNPLAVIEGNASVMIAEARNSSESWILPMAELIHAGAQRMNSLINDLLLLARNSSEPVSRSTVDLSALAQVVCEEIQKGDSSRSVEWTIAKGVTADGDLGLLRVVLDNLIANAWKYTGKVERPSIEFGADMTVVPHEYFIRDNGVGFDTKEVGGRLFNAFQRFHRNNDFPGTGIGLATVQRIIHRHGGRIWAEAAPGKGATFRFVLGPPSG
jgi:two-component system, sensor histidine kinase and response regulator